jgi:tRNA (mo5U34)-methyltransferase
MSADLKKKVAAIPYWYHRIALPGDIVTPGWAPLIPERYDLPHSLAGQRVLDVGTWDGYWTFEALRRGAAEVVAIDDFSDTLGEINMPQRAWDGFDLCRDALGYTSAHVTRRELSVYDVTPENLGMFDTVLFFGTLYHLRHPLLALDRLASVCRGDIFVESAIIDDYSPYRGEGEGYSGHQMVMEFYPDPQPGEATRWWAPTLDCLGAMVQVAGFRDVITWKMLDKPPSPPFCRGFAKASRARRSV